MTALPPLVHHTEGSASLVLLGEGGSASHTATLDGGRSILWWTVDAGRGWGENTCLDVLD